MNGFGQWGQQQAPQAQGIDPNQGAVGPGPSMDTAAANAPGPSSMQQAMAQLPPVAQQRAGGIPLWEWAGVAVVGALLGMTARTFGVQGIASGAALYVLGYWVRGRRPAVGWRYLPSPVMAAIPGLAGPTADYGMPSGAVHPTEQPAGPGTMPGAEPNTVMVDRW